MNTNRAKPLSVIIGHEIKAIDGTYELGIVINGKLYDYIVDSLNEVEVIRKLVRLKRYGKLIYRLNSTSIPNLTYKEKGNGTGIGTRLNKSC